MPYKYTKNNEKVIIRYKNEENSKTFQESIRYCFNLFITNEMKERAESKYKCETENLYPERSEKNVL